MKGYLSSNRETLVSTMLSTNRNNAVVTLFTAPRLLWWRIEFRGLMKRKKEKGRELTVIEYDTEAAKVNSHMIPLRTPLPSESRILRRLPMRVMSSAAKLCNMRAHCLRRTNLLDCSCSVKVIWVHP